MLARQAEARDQITEVAMIHRHRGSVAALADLRRAIEAYREATNRESRALFQQVGANRRANQIQSWLDDLNTASHAL
jgi:hypothetical protein